MVTKDTFCLFPLCDSLTRSDQFQNLSRKFEGYLKLVSLQSSFSIHINPFVSTMQCMYHMRWHNLIFQNGVINIQTAARYTMRPLRICNRASQTNWKFLDFQLLVMSIQTRQPCTNNIWTFTNFSKILSRAQDLKLLLENITVSRVVLCIISFVLIDKIRIAQISAQTSGWSNVFLVKQTWSKIMQNKYYAKAESK